MHNLLLANIVKRGRKRLLISKALCRLYLSFCMFIYGLVLWVRPTQGIIIPQSRICITFALNRSYCNQRLDSYSTVVLRDTSMMLQIWEHCSNGYSYTRRQISGLLGNEKQENQIIFSKERRFYLQGRE